MRVTVIATGLDDGRVRRSLGDEVRTTDRSGGNVTPLRREAAAPIVERAPAAEEPQLPTQSEFSELVEPAPAQPELRPRSDDFVSPFEDELDVPTFIRRGQGDDDEDKDEPAFLRRSAD
jgi:hypothetical protein